MYWIRWIGVLCLCLILAGQVTSISADDAIIIEDEIRLSYERLSRESEKRESFVDTIPAQYEPSGMVFGSVKLPTNYPTFKIAVETDGLVKITQESLASAGMVVGQTNPHSIQMMSRGFDVAYEFIGDGDAQFEAGEYILFYGEKFDGLRFDEQYSDHNYYWLWSNGSPTTVQTIPSVNTSGYDFSLGQTRSTIEFEEDRIFLLTYINEWVETEPDSWYWQYIIKNLPADLTKTYEIDVPYPATNGNAVISAEVYSRRFGTRTVDLSLNGHSPSSRTWDDRDSVRMTQTLPNNTLVNGINDFSVTLSNPDRDHIAINNLIVEYNRLLWAENNQLFFGANDLGTTRFITQDFNESNLNQYRVWDITNPLQPTQIPTDNTVRSSNGILRVFAQTTPDSHFIATTLANATEPTSIDRYIPANLTPQTGSADWIAITHNTLMAQTNRLATHRQTYSGFQTAVYDIDDIINQVGYGYPNPEAIRLFLRDAATTWAIPPQYALLMGSTSLNPRTLDCTITGCDNADYVSEANLVPTYLAWVDRFLGLVPTDYGFSLLVGDDLVPDIAVGRIPAATPIEAQNVVDKILQHEANLAKADPYTNRYLFAADNIDHSGDFCESNQLVSDSLPGGNIANNFCYDDFISNGQSFDQFKTAVFGDIKTNSALIFNYRGHGSVGDWAGGLANATRAYEWENIGKPSIILSADCLDGNFGYIDRISLGESFLIADQKRGSVAHWSSGGLGYTPEHDILHQGFYDGMFNQGLNRIGDATDFGKTIYLGTDRHKSEIFTFNLLADPALSLRKTSTDSGNIAGVIAQSAAVVQEGSLGSLVTYNVTITNSGTAPDQFTLSLSDETASWGSSSNINTTPTLAPGQTTTVSVTVYIPITGDFYDENITTVEVISASDPLSSFRLPLTTTIDDTVVTAVDLEAVSTETYSTIGTVGVILATFVAMFILTVCHRRATIQMCKRSTNDMVYTDRM